MRLVARVVGVADAGRSGVRGAVVDEALFVVFHSPFVAIHHRAREQKGRRRDRSGAVTSAPDSSNERLLL